MRVHRDWDTCIATFGDARRFAFTRRASRRYDSVEYREGDVLVFGAETAGLPEDVLVRFADEARLRLPMRAGNRSLNLSNAVAVVVYEAWRQLGFAGSGRRSATFVHSFFGSVSAAAGPPRLPAAPRRDGVDGLRDGHLHPVAARVVARGARRLHTLGHMSELRKDPVRASARAPGARRHRDCATGRRAREHEVAQPREAR
jgi:hypothetical protein